MKLLRKLKRNSTLDFNSEYYGFHYFLQITEALLFLHSNRKVLHRNVCPTSIIITKRGTWKLAGFEFIGKFSLVNPCTKYRCTNRSLAILVNIIFEKFSE